jgi:hypothetical protein
MIPRTKPTTKFLLQKNFPRISRIANLFYGALRVKTPQSTSPGSAQLQSIISESPGTVIRCTGQKKAGL